MSLLSLTLYTVQEHWLLFPFGFPLFKFKRDFAYIVHYDIGIELTARLTFHAFDKIGLTFGHEAFYIGNAQRHSAHSAELKPTAPLIGAFYNLIPYQ